MKLTFLTALTMVAFAANSVLNRAAVSSGTIDPASFALIRVIAGIVILCMVLSVRGTPLPLFRRARVLGAVSLAAYMAGFSLSYVALDAGLGALILFGVVQITMFGWGAYRGVAPTRRQMAGAGVAFAGLLLVLWPGPGSQTDPAGAVMMVIAGIGWAAYTISGKSEPDPLPATAANFVLCLPVLALFLIGPDMTARPLGIGLAVVSGAVTSGLGYALWYALLPRLAQATAAVVQLSVPIIAIVVGAVVLGEPVSALMVMAAALVLGGIGWAVTAPKVPVDHS
ncbi:MULTISPECIES: DMT family transporter [Roseobacteraceae]|jgi:drug/metabolite transporter (DMT)-like permease|uniref:EamA-like transporter family protein n=1 Tax=Pseudosulfitobacter pseudonitzschiae TaxID=1402135 RepID=A0A221K2H5_9RHOB|nr:MULTISPECIES: DMT family transporter [Roseobacteraceae]ASM73196.1 EamA-like transporter family protein [Pseudosulfitobacter pseudonitzschiae]